MGMGEGRGMLLDKIKFVDWMKAHARRTTLGRCAMYVRLGLEAGGLDTKGHPIDAKNYGPFLLAKGACVISGTEYAAGDIAVFEGNEMHPWGHMEVFDGEGWVSDFVQNHFSPYEREVPPSAVYRFP
jgi:hypothetical protein